MAATTSKPQSQDILFTVQGYVTDPKLVGYQILTNYESMYWAPLVGSDAWRLYEVLRSFCHEGNNICYPSIKLLTNILGFKDKRSLIGRVKRVDGKEYQYPGLIEILQNYSLIVAEVTGEEPQVKYVFHVNLTPGLLTDEQLDSLPKLLQQKHDQLLERCQQTQVDLESKKRAPRFPDKQSLKEQNEGGGKFPPPLGNSHAPGGKFPPEQHQYNNTQLTNDLAHIDHNNNSDDDSDNQNHVVVALISHGISKKVAQRLASRYSDERVYQKVEYLDFLVAVRPEDIKKPAAWLRRAIEENYGEPDGFVTKEELEGLAAESERRSVEEEQRQQMLQERTQTELKAAIAQRRDEYGTTDEDVIFWEKVQKEAKYTMSPNVASTLDRADILRIEDSLVLVGVDNAADWRALQHPGTQKSVERTLSHVAGRLITLQSVQVKSPISDTRNG